MKLVLAMLAAAGMLGGLVAVGLEAGAWMNGQEAADEQQDYVLADHEEVIKGQQKVIEGQQKISEDIRDWIESEENRRATCTKVREYCGARPPGQRQHCLQFLLGEECWR